MKRTSKLNKVELINSDLTARIMALCNGEDDDIAIMATVACELYHDVNGFDWVGFYFADHKNKELILESYIGDKTDHNKIPFGKGICGQVAISNKNFDLFRDSEEGLLPRKKIRIRNYPNSEDKKNYLEIKYSSVEGRFKTRKIN